MRDCDVCATFMHTFAGLIKESDCATMKIITKYGVPLSLQTVSQIFIYLLPPAHHGEVEVGFFWIDLMKIV